MTGEPKVRMLNPSLPDNDPIYVPESVVGGHERMGWVIDADQDKPLPAEAPAKTPTTDVTKTPATAPGVSRPRSSATTDTDKE